MQTLELNEKNLRKGVNPEDEHLTLTSLNYESFEATRTAALVRYTAPSGKIQILKDRFGEAARESETAT